MATERRIEKLNAFLIEELSKIIAREVEFPEETLVTITRVALSFDRKSAKIFVSLLGPNPKEAMEILLKKQYNIQQILNRKVRMRPVPKIRFEIDREELRREKVEKSLSKLKRKGEI